MTVFGVLWIVWGVAFAAIEGAALIRKDRPGERNTLSANLRWLAGATGPWHVAARIVMLGVLAWLPGHLGLT